MYTFDNLYFHILPEIFILIFLALQEIAIEVAVVVLAATANLNLNFHLIFSEIIIPVGIN
jgi:hypothetical protein